MTDSQLVLLRALAKLHPSGTTLNDKFRRVAGRCISYGWVECMCAGRISVYTITDEGLRALSVCLANMNAVATGA